VAIAPTEDVALAQIRRRQACAGGFETPSEGVSGSEGRRGPGAGLLWRWDCAGATAVTSRPDCTVRDGMPLESATPGTAGAGRDPLAGRTAAGGCLARPHVRTRDHRGAGAGARLARAAVLGGAADAAFGGVALTRLRLIASHFASGGGASACRPGGGRAVRVRLVTGKAVGSCLGRCRLAGELVCPECREVECGPEAIGERASDLVVPPTRWVGLVGVVSFFEHGIEARRGGGQNIRSARQIASSCSKTRPDEGLERRSDTASDTGQLRGPRPRRSRKEAITRES
jgi:hypothetical protein